MGRAAQEVETVRTVAMISAGLVGCTLLFGCGPRRVPYSATDLRADSSSRAGRALVHYLAQPGADPAVCDRQAPEFALASFTERDVRRFVSALSNETLPPALWRACASHLLEDLDEERARFGADRMLKAFIENLDAAAPDELARLDALAEVLSSRPPTVVLAPEGEGELRSAVASSRAAAPARARAAPLLASLELDRGMFEGAPLDPSRIGGLADAGILRPDEHASSRSDASTRGPRASPRSRHRCLERRCGALGSRRNALAGPRDGTKRDGLGCAHRRAALGGELRRTDNK
ncbi:MAG: hypothetical protein H5U40_00615 [Polyangiaceae bacterium]|nr:hypothetical protein [Polyangiaceae bacterium]